MTNVDDPTDDFVDGSTDDPVDGSTDDPVDDPHGPVDDPHDPADVDSYVTHEQVIANDVRLHVVTAGPEDGDLVVLLHGFPEFWYSWRHQIPALAEAGYRVIAPDMRGYNRSEKPRGVSAYRLEELVGDVEGLVRAVGRGRAHVVGHDWGGVVAWATAIEVPEVVETLTIMNAPHPIKYVRELSLEQLRRSWYVFYFQLPWLPERLLAARDFALLDRLFREGTCDPAAFTDREIDRYKDAFDRPGALTSAISYYRSAARDGSRRHLLGNLPIVGDRLAGPIPTITAPTLLLWGERDAALSTKQTWGLERYVEDVRIRRFSNASHWVQIDRPQVVTDELLAFLP